LRCGLRGSRGLGERDIKKKCVDAQRKRTSQIESVQGRSNTTIGNNHPLDMSIRHI